MTDIAKSERSWHRLAEPQHLGETQGVTLVAETAHCADEVVVSVRGELDIASAPPLRRRLCDLLSTTPERLTVDLHDLEFIDSAGLHALDAVRRLADERHVIFTLAS